MLRSSFVLLILIPGFFMALRDRFVALLMYLWFAFFKPQDWIWIDISSLRLSLVFGLVLVVPAIFSGIWPNLTHLLSVGNALFLATAFVAHINAVDQAQSWYWVDFLTRLTLICLFTVSLVTTKQRLIWVLAVVAGSFGFHAGKAGVASLAGGGLRFAEGLTGAFADNNGYAMGTVMVIPLLLAVALNAHLLMDDPKAWQTKWIRRGFYAAIPACAFTVVSTFSRGGFLGLAAALLFYVALHQKRVRLSMAGAAFVVLGLTFAPIPDGYFDRLETITNYEEIGEESAMSRTHFWEVAVVMADARPLGVGLRNFGAEYDKYDFTYGRYGQHRDVHSSHFQVLSEQGVIGLAVWIGQFALAGWVALRVRRRSQEPGVTPEDAHFMVSVSNCLSASMAGFVIGGSFVSLALNDITWLTFALLAALDRMTRAMVVSQPVPVLAAVPEPRSVPRTLGSWKPPSRPIAARLASGHAVQGKKS